MKLTRIFIASQFNAFNASVRTGPKTGEEGITFFKLYWTQNDVLFLFVRLRRKRCIRDPWLSCLTTTKSWLLPPATIAKIHPLAEMKISTLSYGFHNKARCSSTFTLGKQSWVYWGYLQSDGMFEGLYLAQTMSPHGCENGVPSASAFPTYILQPSRGSRGHYSGAELHTPGWEGWLDTQVRAPWAFQGLFSASTVSIPSCEALW